MPAGRLFPGSQPAAPGWAPASGCGSALLQASTGPNTSVGRHSWRQAQTVQFLHITCTVQSTAVAPGVSSERVRLRKVL